MKSNRGLAFFLFFFYSIVVITSSVVVPSIAGEKDWVEPRHSLVLLNVLLFRPYYSFIFLSSLSLKTAQQLRLGVAYIGLRFFFFFLFLEDGFCLGRNRSRSCRMIWEEKNRKVKLESMNETYSRAKCCSLTRKMESVSWTVLVKRFLRSSWS